MARDPIVVAGPGRTTSRLTTALLVLLAVVAVGFTSLSYAYWRTTQQLDKVRAESVSSRIVLARIEKLAGLFAELASPDADRAATRERLAELAEEIRASQPRNQRATGTTTSTSSTTSTTTRPSTTTTTSHPCRIEVGAAGVCVR